MADLHIDEINESMRNLVLAGIGAVAAGAEQGQKVVEELVRKGEGVVKQSKVANTELSRHAKDAASNALHDASAAAHNTAQEAAQGAKDVVGDVMDAALKARLSLMSDEERENYVAKVGELAQQIVEERKARAEQEAAEAEAQAAEHADEEAQEAQASDTETAAE
ncbi:hypothetical protein GCM10007377_13190 [Galliscardovia ingluviei]|uniref:Cytosolic protein n=1 Tax=Galliscardovia ingluviei TaxID=1769422 RepID=A0A8J3AI36_9BIFI|nr:phasin family protein [Galliscardovia ingluviei]GGI14892.1 hypothetical protein GCM10007377_13190 [Galliscardovia ingluviei]